MDEKELEALSSQGFTASRQGTSKLKNRIFRWGLGFVSFLIGLVIFLPVDQWGRMLLRRMAATGIPIDAEQVQLSLAGQLGMQKVSVTLPGSGASLEIDSLSSNLKLIDLIFSSTVDLDIHLENINTLNDYFQMRGGQYDIAAIVKDLDKNVEAMNGQFILIADSIMLSANQEIPFLNDKLATRLSIKEFNAQIANGKLQLQKLSMVSNLFRLSGKGSVQLRGNNTINFDIQLFLNDSFFKRHEEAGVREILLGFQVLNPDGSINLKIGGSISRPVFEPVKIAMPQEPSLPPG